MSQDPIIIPPEDLGRQAVRSLGGYIYQLYQTVAAWLRLPDDGVLSIEVTEDYAVLIRNAIQLVQVKDTKNSGNVTLRNEGVLSLIDSHLRLQNANPTKTIVSAFLTTSDPGHEQGMSFPGGVGGLEYWNQVAEKQVDVEPLRTTLLQLDLSSETKEFLTNASSSELKAKLVDSLKWFYSTEDFESVRQSIRDALVNLGHSKAVPSNDAEEVEYALIGELMQLIVSSEKREVNRATLLRIFDRVTSVTIPRAILRKILGSAPASETESPAVLTSRNPICKVSELPLAPRIATRKKLVASLTETTVRKTCAWIYGSTGLGKTTLCLLAAQGTKDRWRFVDFRKCTPDEIKVRLSLALPQLMQENLTGIILDDYPIRHVSSTLLSLVQFVSIARSQGVAVLVTCSLPPTPELQTRIGQGFIEVFDVPYLTEEDVAELVPAAGGDPGVWAKVIHTFTGGGHPQLVDARILGLSERGWPQDELIRELISGSKKPEEVRAQYDAAFARLAEELPPDSRRLLYRLSLCSGAFDHQLALALGEITPPVELPGESLQHLSGPWIEARGEDRFTVSPLVSDSGMRNLSKQEQSAVRRAVTHNLIRRVPFPSDQLSQLLLASYSEQISAGLRWFAGAMLQHVVMDRDLFSLMAQEVSVLALFRLDRPLCPSDQYLSAMLRIVQFFVAVETEGDKVSEIFDTALNECRALEDPVVSSGLLLMLVAKALMRRDGLLRPKQWLPLVAELPTLLENSGAAGEGLDRLLAESTDTPQWKPEQFLFVCQASALPDVDSLVELFSCLNELEPGVRNNLLDSLDKEFRGRRLLIDNSWANEGKRGSIDGFVTAAKYAKLAEMASSWNRLDLELDCICAQAVLLDEYADGAVQALSVLEQGTRKFGANDRLRHRKQVVLYGQKKHKESLDAFPEILSSLHEDPIDRVYALRYAAISAVEIGQPEDAIQFFTAAARTGLQDKERLPAMAAGLLGDAAIVQFRRGAYSQAMSLMVEALKVAETLDPKESRHAKYCSVILGHLALCLWQDAQKPPGERQLANTVPGSCSNPNPAEELLERPLQPLLMHWYLLALAEINLDTNSGMISELRSRTVNGAYSEFEVLVYDAQVSVAIQNGDADAFVTALPEYLDLTSTSGNSGNLDSAQLKPLKHIAPARWDEDQYFPHFAQSVLAFALHSVSTRRIEHLDLLISALQNKLHNESVASRFLDILKSPCTWPSRGNLQYIAADSIAACRNATDGISGDNALRITYYLWGWLRQNRFEQCLEGAVANFVSGLWVKVMTDSRFTLMTPAITIPAIETVLNGQYQGTKKLAAIALVAAKATSAPLDQQMCAELQSFLSDSPSVQ